MTEMRAESSPRAAGAMERGVWRRAGYRYGNRSGGCCGCWNKGRNGRCFGAGKRCCYGRRHKSRCGTKAGSRCHTRTGRGSGCRCSAGTRCCWGSSTEGRYESRAWGRSDGRWSARNGCSFRRCSGCRNEGHLGGKDSPQPSGGRENGVASEVRSKKPYARSQKCGRRPRRNGEPGEVRRQRLDV